MQKKSFQRKDMIFRHTTYAPPIIENVNGMRLLIQARSFLMTFSSLWSAALCGFAA